MTPYVDPKSTSSIASIVLSNRKAPAWSARWFALGVGITVHLGVGLASAMLPPPAPAVLARQPVRISVSREVQLPPPPEEIVEASPEPPVEEAEARPSREAPTDPAPAPAEPAPAEPAPAAPAMAADVVETAAPAPGPAEPVDFTAVTGGGEVYAGGVTASTGTSTRAVQGENVDARRGFADGTGTGTPPPQSRARPVGPPTRAWTCAWPRAADDLDVDVQYVTMRVTVEADGSITDARVVGQYGYGFDEEARRCALRHRLPAAWDHAGDPVRSPSHGIRLRIER